MVPRSFSPRSLVVVVRILGPGHSFFGDHVLGLGLGGSKKLVSEIVIIFVIGISVSGSLILGRSHIRFNIFVSSIALKDMIRRGVCIR